MTSWCYMERIKGQSGCLGSTLSTSIPLHLYENRWTRRREIKLFNTRNLEIGIKF
uniref:Uncharacterized protein n=1 Tax=Rhizophora mucronata TaxID=61149 RepID=A0A2P2M582_RHIMU